MNIGWIIPDIKGGGSGGGNAILDHIKDLSELYNQTIYSQSTDKFSISLRSNHLISAASVWFASILPER